MPPAREEKGGAIRPTLFIGLGGTGKEVLLRLRRKFYENFNMPGLPCVAYLWLDTDIRAGGAWGEPLDIIYESVRFTDTDSLALLEGEVGQAFVDVFDNRGRWGYIHDWLYPEVERKGGKISDGAGNVRSIGRLAFFYHHERVQGIIDKLSRDLLMLPDLRATQEFLPGTTMNDFDLGVQVFIVFSVAGGTGGGSFLDTTFLLTLLQKKMQKQFKHVAGICVLPDVYFRSLSDEQSKRSYANAYAALKELEHYTFCVDEADSGSEQTGDSQARSEKRKKGIATFDVVWTKGDPQSLVGPPVDVTYVLGAENEKVGIKSRKELFRMVAESLYMDFMPSAFSTIKRSSYSNVVQYLEGGEGANVKVDQMALVQEYSRRYGSFGMSKIEIPVDALRGACAAQLGHDIASYWVRPCADPDMVGSIQHDLADFGLTLDGVARRFDTGWRDKLTQAADSAVAGLRSKAGSCTLADIEEARKALNDVDTHYVGMDTARLDADINIPHRLKVKLPAVTEQLKTVMEQWLVRCLEEPGRGLRGLLAEKTGYLARIQEQLQTVFTSDQSDCAKRRERAEKDAGLWQGERDRFLDELTEAVTNSKVGLLNERDFSVKLLADKVKDAEAQFGFARAEAVLYGLCQQAVMDAASYLVSRTSRLPQFLTDMEAMTGPFLEEKTARLRPGDDVLFIRIFNYDRDWPGFYRLRGEPVSAASEAKGFLAHEGLPRPMSLLEFADFRFQESMERVRALLAKFCDNRFTQDFASYPRDEDVLTHPEFTKKSLKAWATDLALAGLPLVKLTGHFGGKPVKAKREAYLGVSADADKNTVDALEKELGGALASRDYQLQVLKSTRKSEVFLYTICYAFPLPAVPVVSGACHDAYYSFYRDLRENRQFGKLYYQIPLHLDKRWEGQFDDLVLYSEQDAHVAKESLEALLFGSILGVIRRYEKDRVTAYGYCKVKVGRIADIELGKNRKEAMDTLMHDAGLRGRLLAVISEREAALSEQERKAYSYVLMYLSSQPGFTVGTSEHELVDAKHKAVSQAAGNLELPPKGLAGDALADWVRNQVGEFLDWPQYAKFPALKKEAWVDRSGL